MSWLRRLYGLEDESEAEVDPDSVVHVASLPFWQAPLIIHGLEELGIRAESVDTTVPATMHGVRNSVRVFVLERDRVAAEDAIRDLTSR